MRLEMRLKRIADWRANHVRPDEVFYLADALLLAAQMHATPEQYQRISAEFDRLLSQYFPSLKETSN